MPLSFIDHAGTVICTDGAADKLLSHNKYANIVIGDMDSLVIDLPEGIDIIHVLQQKNSDLEKAITFCIKHKIQEITVVGATALRDDHYLANILLILHYYKKISISVVTDKYTIFASQGNNSFLSFKGQIVSLFSFTKTTITSDNLKYKVDHEQLTSPSQGVSNESLGNSFSINSSDTIIVMQSHEKA